MASKDNIREIYLLYRDLHAMMTRDQGAQQKSESWSKMSALISNSDSLKNKQPPDEATLLAQISAFLSPYPSSSVLVEFRRIYESLSALSSRKHNVAVLSFLLHTAVYEYRSPCLPWSGSVHQRQRESHRPEALPFKSEFRTPSTLDVCRQTTSGRNVDTPRTGDSMQKFSFDSKLPELVQDVLYAFSGIQGHYLRKDLTGDYKLDPKTSANLNPSQASMMVRLSELGFFHNQIVQLIDPKGGRSPLGLLGQGLVTKIHSELTNYYGFVAMLQDQNNNDRRSDRCSDQPPLTLLKLILLYGEPLHRLNWITRIADQCQTKKGGELASAVAFFRSNGSPKVKELVNQMLSAVCGPLLKMLSKWMLDGELNDPHGEFFVEGLPDVGLERLWSHKYRVRDAMMPCFISSELAENIVVTGKSVNFLREVCGDETTVKGRDELRECLQERGDDIFAQVPDTKLHLLIDNIYLNTSKQVLDIIMGPQKLLMHLQAMRNYLLLGQGDFADILIASLKTELDRPAQELHRFELDSILETTMRSTNAIDPEILTHLHVQLLGDFEGDLGWDIFALKYSVKGPLATMLEQSMCKYQQLFRQLWRMKHVELVLSSRIWKEQISNAKLLRSMQSELDATTRCLNRLTAQMVHFIHQMQYYISCEVIECLWSRMMDRVRRATNLDQIFGAHTEFLQEVQDNLFMEDEDIYLRMDNVLKTIFKLELWQQAFYRLCMAELQSRQDMEKQIKISERSGQFGVTTEQVEKRAADLKTFQSAIKRSLSDLIKMANEYELYVRQFLVLLTSSTDESTQMFGTRIDFNEYYKKRDQRLNDPLTFAKLRQSLAYNTRMSVSHTTLQFVKN